MKNSLGNEVPGRTFAVFLAFFTAFLNRWCLFRAVIGRLLIIAGCNDQAQTNGDEDANAEYFLLDLHSGSFKSKTNV